MYLQWFPLVIILQCLPLPCVSCSHLQVTKPSYLPTQMRCVHSTSNLSIHSWSHEPVRQEKSSLPSYILLPKSIWTENLPVISNMLCSVNEAHHILHFSVSEFMFRNRDRTTTVLQHHELSRPVPGDCGFSLLNSHYFSVRKQSGRRLVQLHNP